MRTDNIICLLYSSGFTIVPNVCSLSTFKVSAILYRVAEIPECTMYQLTLHCTTNVQVNYTFNLLTGRELDQAVVASSL